MRSIRWAVWVGGGVASSIRIKARKSRSSGSGEHSIDAVTVASFEVIATHPMLGLDVPNDRLDRSAATHLAADRGGDAAYLAADPDAEFLGVVVAAIAFVDVDAAGLDPGQRLQLGNDRPKVWPSKGLPCSALACSTNWPPPLSRGRALADPFDLGSVQRIDLGAPLSGDYCLSTHRPVRAGRGFGRQDLGDHFGRRPHPRSSAAGRCAIRRTTRPAARR